MPDSDGKAGRPFKDHRFVVEGTIYHYRSGFPWRDPPVHFGSWKTAWRCHRRYATDDTWDLVLVILLGQAQAKDLID